MAGYGDMALGRLTVTLDVLAWGPRPARVVRMTLSGVSAVGWRVMPPGGAALIAAWRLAVVNASLVRSKTTAFDSGTDAVTL